MAVGQSVSRSVGRLGMGGACLELPARSTFNAMDADLLIPLAGMLTGIILGFPVIRAVVNLIERKTSGGASDRDIEVLRREVRELRATVDEVVQDRDRMLDLEERIDFAERMLAQRRHEGELPGS